MYPQTYHQVSFFTSIIFTSAFFEAFIMSSFTSEMGRIALKNSARDVAMEYIKFSLHIHKLPDSVIRKV